MTTKDRIAISISAIWILIMALVAAEYSSTIMFGGNERGNGLYYLAQFSSPVFFYWAYRFIKNDISFLRRSPKTINEKDIGTIDSKADALLKWNDLLAKGAITQEEYDKAKRDLLG
jgi:uncharacterized membrane protein